MSKRIERVNSLVQKEIGKIILREMDFPPDILVTITGVETSIDLAHANIYIAVLPSIESKNILDILNKAIYELQKKLDKRLRMKPVPQIKFVEEKQTAEAAKIERLLRKAKNEEKSKL